jgi:nitroreductase
VDVHEALYTTRAMRRLRPDPVPRDVEARILDAAIRAPSGGNLQQWRFLMVDDRAVKEPLARMYRESISWLWSTLYGERLEQARATPDDPEHAALLRMQRSAQHLADHFEDVPLLLLAFVRFDPHGASIYPAVWSAMLAARAEGVGSALTTVLSRKEDEVKALLDVPTDRRWDLSCCVTFGYPTGRWGVAARRPVHEVAARNSWDTPLGYEIPDPLWPPTP